MARLGSSKWAPRIWIRDKEHDGPGMGATLLPRRDQADGAGQRAGREELQGYEIDAVRSIITNPANGANCRGHQGMKLRGAAWAGDHTVRQVDCLTNFGASWTKAKLANPKNKYDWQRWTAAVKLPSDAITRSGRAAPTPAA